MNLLKYVQIFSLIVTLILFSNCGSNETDPTGMGIDEPTIDPMILDLDGDGITNDADTCDKDPCCKKDN